MNAAASPRLGAFMFGERPQPGYARAFGMAFAVHAILLAVLFLGVRVQSHAPQTVSVELWEPPPPVVRPVEPPPPAPPKVEPEPPKPEPKMVKPEIVEKPAPKKPEPKKPEPKKAEAKKPEPKKAEPKVDTRAQEAEFRRQMNEQLAREQAANQDRQIKDQLAREAASAKARALNEYIARIQQKVKSNWLLPTADIQGNPEAVFLVSQLPTGEVLSVKLVKTSGNAALDTAIERAILKSSPLPLPRAKEDFSRELRLTFRPKD